MDVQSTQFDSHRFVKRLTNAGLPEEVAEILADEHTKLIVPKDIATKGDVGKVEAGLEVVRGEMATKVDLHREIAASEARMEQRLRAAISEAKVSLIKWMVATMLVFSGILVGAMTALQ